jgi:hypothetical protein
VDNRKDDFVTLACCREMAIIEPTSLLQRSRAFPEKGPG